jgi:AcrR family transcriptional regulator
LNQQIDIAKASSVSGPFAGEGEAVWQGEDLSVRQREVLDVVLALMVEAGDGFSMAKVCRRASCSKETLYNWFDDRDGLLTATVQYQASKVIMPGLDGDTPTPDGFRLALIAFAANWLSVITSEVSAALNRLAISHAGSGKSRLGEIVLQNGPLAMTRRLRPIFEIGEASGLIVTGSMDAALKTFFGMVVGDWQIRKLLGEDTRPSASGIEMTAKRAVDQFLVLYGAGAFANLKSTHTVQTGE